MDTTWPNNIEFSPPPKRAKDTQSECNEKDFDWKIFKDPVHGSIRLHPVLVAIIDTPQFQRLRDVKQLGASYWVFPGACHNRFEHCIGTSFLCGEMINSLKQYHADIISQKDILCIEIAGLCHDLGHGPFSHMFDNNYIKCIDPESHWTHEQGSIDMFDYMVDSNPNVQQAFERFSIGGDEMQLIKDLIKGKNPKKDKVRQKCMFNGREYEKWFLYEIVANKRNGIDCDKFDYLMRDCYFVGTHSNFDCVRYFQNIRIILVDQQLQICARDKEMFNLYELFHTRWSLHHRVYQHKTTKVIEQMIIEAISKVDEKFNISSSIKNMEKFTNLSDSIIHEILRSSDDCDEVKEAKQILYKLQTRDLYKFCGQINTQLTTREEHLQSSQEILKIGTLGIAQEIADMGICIDVDDIFISVVDISFGMKNFDPIESVIFFTKEGNPIKIRKDEISELLPQTFSEKYIRAYCRDASKKSLIQEAFSCWCEEKGFKKPQLLQGDISGYFTDVHKDENHGRMMELERFERIHKKPNVRKKIDYD